MRHRESAHKEATILPSLTHSALFTHPFGSADADASSLRTTSDMMFVLLTSHLSSLAILDTPEADSARAIVARSHQQQLAVLVVPIRLGEVPDRTGWTVVAATTQNCRPRVVVHILVGPLPPHIPYHIHHPEWARSWRAHPHRSLGPSYDHDLRSEQADPPHPFPCGKPTLCCQPLEWSLRMDSIRQALQAGLRPRRGGSCYSIRRRLPFAITPWIHAAVATLRRVLPLPLVWLPLTGPLRLFASILK